MARASRSAPSETTGMSLARLPRLSCAAWVKQCRRPSPSTVGPRARKECEVGGEVGALPPFAVRLRHPVAPAEDLRGEVRDLARRAEVEGEAGAEDHPVGDDRAPGGLEAKPRTVPRGADNFRSQHQPKPRIRRNPQYRIARRRDPLLHHVVEPAELLPVRKVGKAVREAGVDGLLHLVEPRQGRSAADQHHLGRPRLERRRGVVEGRRGEPDHHDPAARESGEVDVVRVVPDQAAQERSERCRNAR